jgi:hypothetical protein
MAGGIGDGMTRILREERMKKTRGRIPILLRLRDKIVSLRAVWKMQIETSRIPCVRYDHLHD